MISSGTLRSAVEYGLALYIFTLPPYVRVDTAATMGSSSQEPDLSDVRIYRRSGDGAAPIAGRTDSTGTLTHSSAGGGGGRRSRSPAVAGPASLSAATAKDYPELVRRQLRWDSFSNTPRSSAKASATSSPAAASFRGIVTHTHTHTHTRLTAFFSETTRVSRY